MESFESNPQCFEKNPNVFLELYHQPQYFNSYLVPYSIRIKFFGTQFQKLYFSRFTNEYYHKKLTSCLENTKNVNSKTVLLIVSPKQAHPDIINLINNPQIYQQIKNNFYMSCYVVQDSDLNKLENVQEGPLIIALRMNIFDEIVQVNRSRDLKDLSILLWLIA